MLTCQELVSRQDRYKDIVVLCGLWNEMLTKKNRNKVTGCYVEVLFLDKSPSHDFLCQRMRTLGDLLRINFVDHIWGSLLDPNLEQRLDYGCRYAGFYNESIISYINEEVSHKIMEKLLSPPEPEPVVDWVGMGMASSSAFKMPAVNPLVPVHLKHYFP
jgi:hypothetical protein